MSGSIGTHIDIFFHNYRTIVHISVVHAMRMAILLHSKQYQKFRFATVLVRVLLNFNSELAAVTRCTFLRSVH